MRIPSNCADWRRAMLGSCATRRMLRRIQHDDCLPEVVVDRFFGELVAEITRNPPPTGVSMKATADWAAERTTRCIQVLALVVLAMGGDVPDTHFIRLARVRPARAYRWALPAAELAAFFRDFFITNATWTVARDDELRDWIEAHQTSYAGDYATAGRSGVAFVADAASLPVPLPSFSELQNLLALVFQPQDRTLGLLFIYPRPLVEAQACPVRVPRCFDGLDYPPFGLERDCSAIHGRTLPFDGRLGMPEAVHRACEIPGRPVTSCEVIS